MRRCFERLKRRLSGGRAPVGVLLASGLLLSGCAAERPSSEADQSREELRVAGQLMAERMCAQCHAVGEDGESSHADAPAFRRISWDYPVRSLEEALAEGIVVGHPDMPVFQFEAGEIDALLTYIESVQEPRGS
ncbi:MAG: cytochrome c [Pseudomonadota bacterium]